MDIKDVIAVMHDHDIERSIRFHQDQMAMLTDEQERRRERGINVIPLKERQVNAK